MVGKSARSWCSHPTPSHPASSHPALSHPAHPTRKSKAPPFRTALDVRQRRRSASHDPHRQQAEGERTDREGQHRHRRQVDVLLPPRRDGRRGPRLRKRSHDPGRDVGRGHHAPAALGFLVQLAPEFHSSCLFATNSRWLRSFTVEPAVDVIQRCDRRKWNFPVRQWGTALTRLLAALSGCLSAPIRLVHIVQLHAYFSSKSAWSASRARCTRILSAPTVVLSRSAISSYERPSTCFMMNASRNDTGSVCNARSRSDRNSLRSSSSSGLAYPVG